MKMKRKKEKKSIEDRKKFESNEKIDFNQWLSLKVDLALVN